MASTTPQPISVSEAEQQVLSLYDRLRGLQLELALLTARHDHMPDIHPGDEKSSHAQRQLQVLEAKTTLGLRNNVVENVLMAQPTLKAVHNATQASPVEKDLLSYIHSRESASTKAATQHSEMQTITSRLTELELERHQVSQQNAELATEVLRLADIARHHGGELTDNTHFQSEIAGLEHEVKMSRQRWKVIKGVTSAVVAESGIDWTRDKRLREMVLDSAE